MASTAPDAGASRNEVTVVGRLAAPADERVLPSGDSLTLWRLVVDRPKGRSTRRLPEGAREVTVDTLECVAWAAGLQRAATGWEPGDVIAVEGALRRRFWRGAGGLASRYEIEVAKAKRVVRAGAA